MTTILNTIVARKYREITHMDNSFSAPSNGQILTTKLNLNQKWPENIISIVGGQLNVAHVWVSSSNIMNHK